MTIRYDKREKCEFCGGKTETWDKSFCQACNIRWGTDDEKGVVEVEVWGEKEDGWLVWPWKKVPEGCLLVSEKWSEEV